MFFSPYNETIVTYTYLTRTHTHTPSKNLRDLPD